METPKNKAGELTEKIMRAVRTRLPRGMETHTYNAVYESVYSVLNAETPQVPLVPDTMIERLQRRYHGDKSR